MIAIHLTTSLEDYALLCHTIARRAISEAVLLEKIFVRKTLWNIWNLSSTGGIAILSWYVCIFCQVKLKLIQSIEILTGY